jgi:N-acylneuraminate cytidylyltransferase
MSVIALVPAREGSKGIRGKNFRILGGRPLYRHAMDCAAAVNCDVIAVSTDFGSELWNVADPTGRYRIIRRPEELCSDTAAMVGVVQHAMQAVPGQPDDIWILLQPTAVFRTPEHVRRAIALLEESGADSVVSVVPLPLTHHAAVQFWIANGELCAFDYTEFPHFKNRQQREQTYIRDGTCYVFWRKTVSQYGTIYGHDCRPLILDPADSCELDTEADWAAVEARWKAHHHG